MKLGHISLQEFWKSMTKENQSNLACKTFESGLAHAFEFLVVIQCPNPELECVMGYNLETREIRTIDGK